MSISEHRSTPEGQRGQRRAVRPAGLRAAGLLAAGFLAAGFLAAACSAGVPRAAQNAPVLTVATGLYPLAQLTRQVGGPKVHVDDVVPDGADPLTWSPPASARATIDAAGLVVQVGGGFQPGFEAASAGARRVLSLRPLLPSGSPFLWLDPATATKAVTAVVAALSAADPEAAPLFRSDARAVQAQLSSLGIDFSSTLSACPGSTIVTPDGAFSTMASAYGLRDLVVPGSAPAPAVAATAAAIRRAPAAAVLAQPWTDNTGVTAVARAAHVRLRRADTLAGPPAGGWPRGSNYFALMEQNLGVISSGLGCPTVQ